MSIQQNFPAISPSLSLNFARSKTLDPRITFTRTSSATRVNETGLVEVVPANEPRFDHSYDPVSGSVRSLGLLVEEQRTNLITYSESLNDAWSPSNVSVGINSTTSPDGNQTADLFIPDSLGSPGYIGMSRNGVGVSTNTSYTVSSFIKDGGYDNIIIFIGGLNTSGGDRTGALYRMTGVAGTSFSNSSLNTANDTTTTHSIEKYPNDWYRVRLSFTVGDSTAISVNLRYTNDSVGYVNSNGDGSSGIYIWGVQLEQGAFPTSYIPRDASTATRSPDNVSMVGENFSSWYNQSEGTVYADTNINGVRVPSFNRLWSFTNSNFNLDGLGFYSSNSSTSDGRYGISGSINGISIYSPNNIVAAESVFDTPRMKSCFGFVEGGNCNISFNGVLPNTNGVTATDFPNVDRFLIGQPQRFQGHSCMTISQLTYYPRRLSNDNLQNLTK